MQEIAVKLAKSDGLIELFIIFLAIFSCRREPHVKFRRCPIPCASFAQMQQFLLEIEALIVANEPFVSVNG